MMLLEDFEELDEKTKNFLVKRIIAIGLLLIFVGALWAAKIADLFQFQYLMPAVLIIGGVFSLAKGILFYTRTK